jgi:CRISPR-associated protein Cas2
MGGLNYYLVSYDISDPDRLRKVERKMRAYGCRLHYSVFRCDLDLRGMAEMRSELGGLINHKEDRVMIINLGPSTDRTEGRITFLGKNPEEKERREIIF